MNNDEAINDKEIDVQPIINEEIDVQPIINKEIDSDETNISFNSDDNSNDYDEDNDNDIFENAEEHFDNAEYGAREENEPVSVITISSLICIPFAIFDKLNINTL